LGEANYCEFLDKQALETTKNLQENEELKGRKIRRPPYFFGVLERDFLFFIEKISRYVETDRKVKE
jgi:hypothetical protein